MDVRGRALLIESAVQAAARKKVPRRTLAAVVGAAIVATVGRGLPGTGGNAAEDPTGEQRVPG